MKRFINACLLISFQFGYLEWGKGQKMFIYEAAILIFQKATHHLMAVLHPFTLIPFLGECLLMYTIFQKSPAKIISLIAVTCLSILMLLLLAIGLLAHNFLITLSTIPFIVIAMLQVRYHTR